MLGVSSLTGCSSPASSQGPGDGKRVVILGAGIAGLTAAYELSKVGYTCEILEATSRAGGRNLTARGGDVLEEMNNTQRVDFDREDYLYANMGPARLPYHHETILSVIASNLVSSWRSSPMTTAPRSSTAPIVSAAGP